MTQLPPDRSGWIDPNGVPQTGGPPPGFWLASDGRWYPPQLGGPPRPQPPKKSRAGLWILLGVLGVVLVGCGGLLAFGLTARTEVVRDGAIRDEAVEDTGSAAAPQGPASEVGSTDSDSGPTDTTETSSSAEEAIGEVEAPEIVGGIEVEDIIGCQRLDAQTIELELVNNSAETSSYFLIVAYLDNEGEQVASTMEFVDHLRSGEHAIEQREVFETTGSPCAVIEVDRRSGASDPSNRPEAFVCEVGDADAFGHVSASLSVSNNRQDTLDYDIDIAIVDDAGIRRGSGIALIGSVGSGETESHDVRTSVTHVPGYRCEVVSVDGTLSG